MSTIVCPKLNKIPGLPVAKETHTKDLTKLTKVELLEMKERQYKLLSNKVKLRHLPDKGKRIQEFYEKVLAELHRRTNVDEAAAMFSELNIAAKAEKLLNQLEWQGNMNDIENNINNDADILDSDDEIEMDPLRILAQRSMHEKRLTVLPAEKSLITATDLEEIKSFHDNAESVAETVDVDAVTIDVKDIKPKLQNILKKSPSSSCSKTSSSLSDTSSTASSRAATPASVEALQDVEQHVRYLVEKTEVLSTPAQREKFMPYKTTISNVHDPVKERSRKQSKHWENTAATPPPIQHSGAKLLPLLDSVELQANYLIKLKELQEEQTAARLAAKLERVAKLNIQLPSNDDVKTKTSFTAYRSVKPPVNHIEGAQDYNEHDEVHDTLDEKSTSAGITYTVYD